MGSVLNSVVIVLSSCGSHAILPSSHRGFRIFSCGYFVGLKLFLVGTLWVQKFFYWVRRGSEFFSRGYFVGPKFFLAGIRGSEIFSREYFVGIFHS